MTCQPAAVAGRVSIYPCTPFFGAEKVQPATIENLNQLAANRGQTLSQLALAWILRKPEMVTALIGASRPEQIHENARAVERLDFTDDELKRINQILA